MFSVRNLLYILAAAMVVAIVFIILPKEKDLFILHRPEVEQYHSITTPLIRDALSIANSRIKLAEGLRSRFQSNSESIDVNVETHFSKSLEEVVSANLNISFGVLSVSVNLISLIQAYIDRYLGRVASYVMVETFSETKSNEGHSLYSINVSILTRGTRVIGREPIGKLDLIDRLSDFFVEELVLTSMNCDASLCASMMPSSEKHLVNLAGSFDALSSLAKVGPCKGTDTSQQCLDSIRGVLTDIVETEGGKTVAEFGLFMVELRQLKEQITTVGTTNQIADALKSLSEHYSHIIDSTEEGTFFRTLLDSDETLQNFLESNRLDDLQLSRKFLSTLPRFFEGRKAYRVGDTAKALENYEAVDNAPPWFVDFLEAYRHISRARSNPKSKSDVDIALEFFSNEELNLVNFFRAALLAQIIRIKVSHESTLASGMRESLFQLSEDALALAVSGTSTLHDELGARIERARNLYAFGRGEAANEEMAEVEKEIARHVDDKEYRLAVMSGALYFAETGAYDKAKVWLEYAAELEFRAICVFQNAPEFRAMRESDLQGIARWTSRIRQRVRPEC